MVNYRRNKAFTLIELLVVISIIALLMSVLMPALGRARKMAQEVVCGTNNRTMISASAVYAADYDGYAPRDYIRTVKGSNSNLRGWEVTILPYLDNSFESFLCPSVSGLYRTAGTTTQSAKEAIASIESKVDTEFDDGTENPTGMGIARTYRINMWVSGGNWCNYFEDSDSRITTLMKNGNLNSGLRVGQVPNPSTVVYFSEFWPATFGRAYISSGQGFRSWDDIPAPHFKKDLSDKTAFGGGGGFAAHRGKCTLGFVDGHVGGYKWEFSNENVGAPSVSDFEPPASNAKINPFHRGDRLSDYGI